MKQALLIFSLAVLAACSPYPAEVEQALRLAGANRAELEKVLTHYAQNEADSLKYRAACFLIENMPYHYAYDSEKLRHFRNELFTTRQEHNVIEDEAMRILGEKYGEFSYDASDIVFDAKVITADYLIRNIEHSFKVWEAAGWREQVSFDDFCEEILPYRVTTEPLEDWKTNYYNTFQPVLDSLLVNKNDPVEACQILYDYITQEDWVLYQLCPIPGMGANTLLKWKLGSCKDRADFMCYVMWSVGIPGGYDFFLQNPENNTPRHFWSFVKDSLGRTIDYTIYDIRPLKKDTTAPVKAYIYRHCFGRQPNTLPLLIKGKQNIPPDLNSVLMKDVTMEYLEGHTLEIRPEEAGGHSYVYLALYSHERWVPVAWAEMKGGKAVFRHAAPGIVYLPVFYSNGVLTPASDPVLVRSDGSYTSLRVEEGKRQRMLLSRKYPKPRSVWYGERSIGGCFQGADTPDFAHPTTLHTITTQQVDMDWHEVELDTPQLFKYLRYISAPESHCNMAEIEFITPAGEILKGEVLARKALIVTTLTDRKKRPSTPIR
jgi:hypothetical protein